MEPFAKSHGVAGGAEGNHNRLKRDDYGGVLDICMCVKEIRCVLLKPDLVLLVSQCCMCPSHTCHLRAAKWQCRLIIPKRLSCSGFRESSQTVSLSQPVLHGERALSAMYGCPT